MVSRGSLSLFSTREGGIFSILHRESCFPTFDQGRRGRRTQCLCTASCFKFIVDGWVGSEPGVGDIILPQEFGAAFQVEEKSVAFFRVQPKYPANLPHAASWHEHHCDPQI